MDPILAEVYSTVMPAAPFVLGAYVGIWICLFVYVMICARKQKRITEDVVALRDALQRAEHRIDAAASVRGVAETPEA